MVLLVYFFETDLELEMLVFVEGGKTRGPWKRRYGQGWEPTTNSTHMWPQIQELNPNHSGASWALSPLCHPHSPIQSYQSWMYQRSQFYVVPFNNNNNLQLRLFFCTQNIVKAHSVFFTKIIGLNWLHQFIVTIFFRPWGSVCGLVYC